MPVKFHTAHVRHGTAQSLVRVAQQAVKIVAFFMVVNLGVLAIVIIALGRALERLGVFLDERFGIR